MELSVVPLHRNKKYTLQCCQLINDEWKRSETARLRSLEKSTDELPISLILIRNDTVIGHLRLSPIPTIQDGCFVESVVIQRELRGRGFGTNLMQQAEEYCRNCLQQLKTIYLSTKGQENFYSKLGYTECQPISIYGSYTPSSTIKYTKNDNNAYNQSHHGAPPPPPLPPKNTNSTSIVKVYMKKDL